MHLFGNTLLPCRQYKDRTLADRQVMVLTLTYGADVVGVSYLLFIGWVLYFLASDFKTTYCLIKVAGAGYYNKIIHNKKQNCV